MLSWEASSAAHIITDALRELSKRAGERGNKVGKWIYDLVLDEISNYLPFQSSRLCMIAGI